jgi:hypothetical protein
MLKKSQERTFHFGSFLDLQIVSFLRSTPIHQGDWLQVPPFPHASFEKNILGHGDIPILIIAISKGRNGGEKGGM